jgi:hypothetical protein
MATGTCFDAAGIAERTDPPKAAREPQEGVRKLMAHGLGGDAPLPTFATHPAGREWTKHRFAQFGLSYDVASWKVAFVNLIPYRSREGAKDLHMLDRLESVRLVRARAEAHPAARAGLPRELH